MDVSDLHDIRDGPASHRRRKANPFIHLETDSPLMRVLFALTRPAQTVIKPIVKRVTRKRFARAAVAPLGSMVPATTIVRKISPTRYPAAR